MNQPERAPGHCNRARASGQAFRRKWFWRVVSRILSDPGHPERGSHLSQRSIPGTDPLARDGAGSSTVPYLILLPGRVSMPRGLHPGRWALTPPFHPYPGPCGPWRYFLCGTVCRRRLGPTPPACIPGLSSGVTRPRALWSSDFTPPGFPRGATPHPPEPRPPSLPIGRAAIRMFRIFPSDKSPA